MIAMKKKSDSFILTLCSLLYVILYLLLCHFKILLYIDWLKLMWAVKKYIDTVTYTIQKQPYYDLYFITVMSIVCQRRRRKQKGNHCHIMLLSSWMKRSIQATFEYTGNLDGSLSRFRCKFSYKKGCKDIKQEESFPLNSL